ncbi:MAG: RNA polymerase sigma-70 factor [Bacteroidales bacterium]|nr:RNA polymerase sigma-70 factor [Bacteroidales bacterium]
MLMDEDFLTLVHHFSQGKESAFLKLFEMYYPRVREFARRIVKKEDVAENIAQDTFVKIWERREAFSPVKGSIKNFSGYLYMIARNSALNHLRRNTRSMRLEENGSYSVTIDEEYYAKEQELIIKLIVFKMPEKRRKVFLMSRFEGLDNNTIAATLHISKKTVENHLTAALKQIRLAMMGV